MNSSMFLPQMPEDDTYDQNGNQTDDINSVAEYIAVALGYDTTVDDEDDDSGQFYHPIKPAPQYCQPVFCEIVPTLFTQKVKKVFPEYPAPALRFMPPTQDAPPPDALS